MAKISRTRRGSLGYVPRICSPSSFSATAHVAQPCSNATPTGTPRLVALAPKGGAFISLGFCSAKCNQRSPVQQAAHCSCEIGAGHLKNYTIMCFFFFNSTSPSHRKNGAPRSGMSPRSARGGHGVPSGASFVAAARGIKHQGQP